MTAEIIAVVVTALAGTFGLSAITQLWMRNFIARILVEARAVVLEVEQTYVDAIKQARDPLSPGGVDLTVEERHEAKRRALTKLKSNLGARGLARLARIAGFGVAGIDGYLSTHVEAAVQQVTIDKAPAETATVAAVK